MAVPKAPPGLSPAGRKLWREVLGRFELDEHEAAMLREACRTVDLLEQLDALVRTDGPMVDGKPHPAAVEARQQRIVLTRLFATLRLPEGESEGRPQRRGAARGAYAAGSSLRSVG